MVFTFRSEKWVSLYAPGSFYCFSQGNGLDCQLTLFVAPSYLVVVMMFYGILQIVLPIPYITLRHPFFHIRDATM